MRGWTHWSAALALLMTETGRSSPVSRAAWLVHSSRRTDDQCCESSAGRVGLLISAHLRIAWQIMTRSCLAKSFSSRAAPPGRGSPSFSAASLCPSSTRRVIHPKCIAMSVERMLADRIDRNSVQSTVGGEENAGGGSDTSDRGGVGGSECGRRGRGVSSAEEVADGKRKPKPCLRRRVTTRQQCMFSSADEFEYTSEMGDCAFFWKRETMLVRYK